MNWLYRISALEEDWWKRWKHHLQQNLINAFGIAKVQSSFGQYNLTVNFEVPVKGHVYSCSIKLNFNEYIADKVNYRKPRGTEVITHDVEGVEDLSSLMTGSAVYILRDAGSGRGKGMGPVELLPQESAPYQLVNTIKEMIANDRDDGEGGAPQDSPITDPSQYAPTNPELAGV